MSKLGMPQFYQKKDFKTDKLKEMYGTSLSKRDLRRFNRYMNSEQGQKDWLAHEDSESQKYMQSWEDRIAASHAKAKNMMSKANESPIQPQITTPIKPVNVETPEAKPVLTSKSNDYQNAEAPTQQNIKADPVAVTTTSQTPAPVMSLNEFRNHQNFRNHYGFNKGATINIEGKEYPIMVSTGTYNPGSKNLYNDHTYAYDPETGLVRAVDESFIGVPNQRWKSGAGWVNWNESLGLKHKQGGIMNKIKYFQQGGAAPQQDIKAQVTALVQAAMQGDQKATQTVNQIMEAAKAGDQKAVQLAQMIQAVAQQMQGQATSAKWGSKLSYIKSIKYAKGGKACPVCQKKVEEKACGGKAKKRYFGGWL